MTTVILNRFNQSMGPDKQDSSTCQLCKHFDNFTTKSLTPYRSSEDAYAGQGTFHGQNFTMDAGNLYILGINSGKAGLVKTTDVANPSFSTPTGSTSTVSSKIDSDFFLQYKHVLWGTNAQGFWSYTIASTTLNESAYTFTYTTISNAIVHSKDSKGYVGYNDASGAYILVKDGSSAWTVGITIPTTIHKIVSICEFQNLVAIGFAPLEVGGNSFVILWDRSTTTLDVTDYIDVGNTILYTLEQIDGYLIAVSLTGNTTAVIRPKMVCARSSGGAFHTFKEIYIASAANSIVGKQKINNRLYFGLNASSYGYDTQYDYTGIWSIGRESEAEEFKVSLAQLPNNDTVAQAIKGFYIVQDYFYISYLDGSGAYSLSKTNDQAVYAVTSQYITSVNPGNMTEIDKFREKKLKMVALTYEPLPGTGSSYQVSLSYKVNDSDFSPIFTKTDDSVITTKVINEATADADGNQFNSGRDIEFLISSKGVKVTGLIYQFEPEASQIA